MTSSIPFFDTFIDPSAKKLIWQTLKSTMLSEGKLVAEFEQKLSEIGLQFPVAVNSGTSALHLALVLANIKPGDEVILPAQTFVASALAVLYVGAKPVFADIEYLTGNIDISSLEAKITPKTKAIMPVHWAGYPVDLEKIKAVANKHNLIVIEDAAHALGASYKNKAIGSLSDFTCFSFQAIKHVTTGDGGAVCSRIPENEQRAKKLRWFGIDRTHATPSILGERQYILDEIGYKYHLNDYSGALGIANLNNFSKRLMKRERIAKKYISAFKRISGITLFNYQKDRQSSWWLFGMHVDRREDFIRAMQKRGVPSSVVHQRIDKHPIFGGPCDLQNQTKFDQTQIHLPVYDRLTSKQVDQIIESVQKGW